MNQSSQNSIVIRWRTTQAVLGRVNYGTAIGSLSQIANETTARTDHIVQLSGITPYTRYYYSLGSAAGTLAGNDAEHTFRTPPVPGTATDAHLGGR